MKILVVGTGNMGGAFASALSREQDIQLSVYDKDIEKAQALSEGKRMTVLSSLEEGKGMDAVIIAVKPQTLPMVYPDLKALEAKLYISICAGVTLEVLEKNLGTDKLVRFMPNIAASVGKAVTAVAYGKGLSEDEKEIGLHVASLVGSAFLLEENLFSAFIGISGSGIAYVFEFMHQMAMGGVREGIPYAKALDIVRDTIDSAITLQKNSGKGAIELETMVSSPKGTTIEGLMALEDGSFGSAVRNAVSAASWKSQELEKNAR